MKNLALAVAFSAMATTASAEFREDFNTMDTSRWTVSTWTSPGQKENHRGEFKMDNVEVVNGHLRLRLDQFNNEDGKLSLGAEVGSVEEFGYGTYEFRMRASTTSPTPNGAGEAVSGAVSAAFVYAPAAITEIDVEFESNRPGVTHFLSWWGETRKNQHTEKKLNGVDQFHVYKFVWTEAGVEFYRDDVLVSTHKRVVPSTPGRMLFNHWGTHSDWWGGFASPGVTRYVYVDWFQFTPLQ